MVPATADILGKAAHGLANDLLSTVLLATRAPILWAPAMNTGMWEHPAVQANLAAKASVLSAKAALDRAALNVEFTRITSPLDGIAGLAKAQVGDLITPNSSELTTVATVDPIKAYFPLGESDYLRLADRINKRPAKPTGKTGGTPGALWGGDNGLTLMLADGSVYPERGRFLAADREIDPKTGTIRISSTFPNPNGTLRPGQYARVRAEIRSLDQAYVVPQRAVAEVQGAFQVQTIDASNRITPRRVKAGDRLGSGWVIESGLETGDRVVVEGAPAAPGTVVNPKPWEPPAAAPSASSPSPSPAAPPAPAPARP